MREWHHVNLRSNQKSRTIPSNRLVTSSSNKDSQIIYEGSYDEVLGIANGLPGSSSVPACWLMRGHWKEIFPSLSEPSFKWLATGQEELCLTKIDKMLKSDYLKNNRSGAEKKLGESSQRNPYLPLPPPPFMPHPDEIGVSEKEEEEIGKEVNEEQDQKESERDKKMDDQDVDKEEDYDEEEEFVDGNISDWLEY